MQSDSPAFSLNAIDLHKILVGFEVACAGGILTYVIPAFTRFSYIYTVSGHSFDFTLVVSAALMGLAQLLRKFVANNETLGSGYTAPKSLWESVFDALVALGCLLVVVAIPFVLYKLIAIAIFLLFVGKALVDNRPAA